MFSHFNNIEIIQNEIAHFFSEMIKIIFKNNLKINVFKQMIFLFLKKRIREEFLIAIKEKEKESLNCMVLSIRIMNNGNIKICF